MKHLITGAAGFIGSNLAKRLLGEGEKVIGIDSFTDYYSRSLKENNIKNILFDDNFTFIEKNLLRMDLNKLLDGVDYIYHQAAQAGVRSSWGEDFEIYNQNNILLTQKLLEAAKDNKQLKKFIYASSSSVYGDTDQLPMQENNRLQPVSPYGVSKLAAKKAPSGEIINIGGSGKGIILNDTLDLIKNITGCKTEINYIEKVKGDVKHTSADTSKAEKLLDYYPKVSFKEGLKKEVEWLKKIYL